MLCGSAVRRRADTRPRAMSAMTTASPIATGTTINQLILLLPSVRHEALRAEPQPHRIAEPRRIRGVVADVDAVARPCPGHRYAPVEGERVEEDPLPGLGLDDERRPAPELARQERAEVPLPVREAVVLEVPAV